jgi:hypothetical protein
MRKKLDRTQLVCFTFKLRNFSPELEKSTSLCIEGFCVLNIKCHTFTKCHDYTLPECVSSAYRIPRCLYDYL